VAKRTATASVMLDIRIERHKTDSVPRHHVVAARSTATWTSYLPRWNSTLTESRPPARPLLSRGSSTVEGRRRSSDKAERIGFCNPWPSWHKATQKETWDALEWGSDNDPCIQLAVSAAASTTESSKPTSSKPFQRKAKDFDRNRAQEAGQLLRVLDPDFSFNAAVQDAKVTWLGHAGTLVQLPSLKEGLRPFRCIFDPIFSMRCSPIQAAGPIRAYLPPCEIKALPPIDVVMISHNHYDHLDYDTIMGLWEHHKSCIHFLVPLGNKQWFVDSGISADRVSEMDWWDSIHLSHPDTQTLKITCTPAQHGSGRSGLDTNASLWSSWYIEHPAKPYRVFFAGDSGYQFHASPNWPPSPRTSDRKVTDKVNSDVDTAYPTYPACPAFAEIADRIGSPHLLLLPISVGATYSYLRSNVPLPDSISPFPRHKSGLTGANHMPPWDAVRVLRLMASKADPKDQPSVAIGIHWGTFVTEPVEVLKTLGQLQCACENHGVDFARSLDSKQNRKELCFLALNHGQSVDV